MLHLNQTLSAELTPQKRDEMRVLSNSAYYCQPRMYYCNLSQTDGVMLVQLCMAERAVSFTEDVVYRLRNDKKLFTGACKKHLNMLSNPKGNSYAPNASNIGMTYVGHLRRYRRDLDRNLQNGEEDERMRFADVNDFIDEAVKSDLNKMRYAVKNHANRNMLKNADMVADVAMAMLLCDFYQGLSNYVKETIHGSMYVLCGDGGDPKKREEGLYLSNGLLQPVVKELEGVFEAIGPKRGVEFDKCQPVMDGMRILINKMLSIDIMAPACKAAGVCDIRDEVAQRVVNLDATPDEAAKAASGKNYMLRYKEAASHDEAIDAFRAKGWKVG